MASLSTFPAPCLDEVTICERNGVLIGSAGDSLTVVDYSHINTKLDDSNTPHTLSCMETTCKPAFISEDTILERLRHKWISQGLEGVLKEVSLIESIPLALQNISQQAAGSVSWFKLWLHRIFAFQEESLSFSHTIAKSRHCKLKSHKHIGKLALPMKDDSVKIIQLARIGGGDIVLKDKRQKNISCVEWRPLSSLSIAVGCEDGILVWLLDPSANLTRPSSTMTRFLSTPEHVVALSWSPDGQCIACAFDNSSTFLVWNIITQESTPVHRLGASLLDLSWSPCGQRLFSSTASNGFRVWESETWQCEKWGGLKGHCTCACWSPCGSILLFSVSEENVIYYATFYSGRGAQSMLAGSGVATKCAETSPHSFEIADGNIELGGIVSDLAWDSTGTRLAALFSGEPEQPCVALFSTRIQPVLQLVPCGFISGKHDEVPRSISFVNGFDKGAMLAIHWSSDHLSTIPLLFNQSVASSTTSSSRVSANQPVLSSADAMDTTTYDASNVSLYSTLDS